MDPKERGGAAEAVQERLGCPEADEAVGVKKVERGGEDAADADGEGVAHKGEAGGGVE